MTLTRPVLGACQSFTLTLAALLLAASCCLPLALCRADAELPTTRLGVTRGIVVVLGEPNCASALNLARNAECLVYAQLPNADDVAAARQRADAAGLYGRRIWIDQGSYDQLHLADNLADGLVAVGSAGSCTRKARRSLATKNWSSRFQ